jgi:hypothetical protein
MTPDIVSATYMDQYRIEITFEDGKRGVVDFAKYLKKDGVFELFKDIEFFKNFEINQELGTLTWQNQADIAPETLYAEATGTPLPDWIEQETKSAANKSLQPTGEQLR